MKTGNDMYFNIMLDDDDDDDDEDDVDISWKLFFVFYWYIFFSGCLSKLESNVLLVHFPISDIRGRAFIFGYFLALSNR